MGEAADDRADMEPTSNKPMIETVADKKVLSDRTRTVELYFLAGTDITRDS